MNHEQSQSGKSPRAVGGVKPLAYGLAFLTVACSSLEDPTSPSKTPPRPNGQIKVPASLPQLLNLIASPSPKPKASPTPAPKPTPKPTPVASTPTPKPSATPIAPPPTTLPPSPPPSRGDKECPTPHQIRIKVHVPYGSNGWVIDSVALTCDPKACTGVFAGRQCCPLGAEGSDRRDRCEEEMVPDGPKWEVRKGKHRGHSTNPWLHYVTPPGSVRACLPQGRCSDWLSVGGG
jgi:hypothetical protein